MWKQWQIEGGKEKGEENADDEEETTLSKVDDKVEGKRNGFGKGKDDKGKNKETRTCNHSGMKGHIKINCWKKNPLLNLRNSKARKPKAGVAAEEEHLLSFMDILDCADEVEVDYEFHNNVAFVQVELGLDDEDVEDTEGVSQIRPTIQALNSPYMWIGDTGVTRHSTKYKQGGVNSRSSTSRTRGIYGQAIKLSMEVDLPGMYCDKNGDNQFSVKLQDVDVIPENHYNLISLTKLMEEGHKVIGNKKDGLSVEKGGRVIKFDIRIETPKGVLWCAFI